MGISVMTCTLLWAAFSAAYLVYCINGETMDDRELLSATTLKSQAVPEQWRRHLHQQVHCGDDFCGMFQANPPSIKTDIVRVI